MIRTFLRLTGNRTLAARLVLAGFTALAANATATAAPPPGERWSDHAWGRGKPGSSAYDARPRGPSTGAARFRTWPPAPAYTVPYRTALPAAPGGWVRGADGVYRWWPPVVHPATP